MKIKHSVLEALNVWQEHLDWYSGKETEDFKYILELASLDFVINTIPRLMNEKNRIILAIYYYKKLVYKIDPHEGIASKKCSNHYNVLNAMLLENDRCGQVRYLDDLIRCCFARDNIYGFKMELIRIGYELLNKQGYEE